MNNDQSGDAFLFPILYSLPLPPYPPYFLCNCETVNFRSSRPGVRFSDISLLPVSLCALLYRTLTTVVS